MTRVFDDPVSFADDALDGFVAANGSYVARVPGGVVRATETPNGQVALVVGGGSGHYPAFAGVVGVGIAAGAVCGNVFTSPSATQAYSVARSADHGGGVLFSFGNYAGDVLHFGEAVHRLEAEGIDARIVVCTDDIASAPMAERSKRRGIAGDFTVFKIAGAAAERGLPIDEVERLARSANERTRTLGVAFAGCTLPGESGALFTVPEGQMSIGLGIHGEPGISDQPIPPARELAGILVSRLLADVPDDRGSRVAVVLNGLGTVKYEELFVLYGHVARLLTEQQISIVEPECGELVTSLDMAGLSLTLFWLDDELEPLWTDAADTPAYRKGNLAPRARAKVEVFTSVAAGHLAATDASRHVARTVADLIASALSTVVDNADELGRIDAIAGDGDHGTGMVRGLRAADESAASAVTAALGVAELLTSAGQAWSDRAGGTSGALWGAALVAAGAHLGDRAEYPATVAAEALSSAVGAIVALGKAQPGDKTMVDSMLPFVQAFTSTVATGGSAIASLEVAARAATEAAAATADLVPRLGRARPLAEKSLGHPDAGATSFALIVSRVAAEAAANTPSKAVPA